MIRKNRKTERKLREGRAAKILAGFYGAETTTARRCGKTTLRASHFRVILWAAGVMRSAKARARKALTKHASYTGTVKRFNITREYEPVFSATEV